MHETMNFQLWKEHREEAMREVERNRLATAFRVTRKLRAGRSSALVWEIKLYTGGLLKHLRASRSAG